MKRVLVWSALLVLASVAHAGLEGDIQKVLDDKSMHGKDVGIEIVRLTDGKVIYAKDATTPRRPASNLKLVTTAAALNTLGADFKFRTKLILRGSDLILVGDGDPSLGDAEMLEGTGWGTTTVFQHWAAELKKRGITNVNNVIVDDSVFDDVFLHPKWSASQYMQPHSAEVCGIALNANLINVNVKPGKGAAVVTLDPASRSVEVQNSCVTGRANRVVVTREKDDSTLVVKGEVKSAGMYQVTVHDPAIFAGGALADVLAGQGVEVSGKVIRQRGAGSSGGTVVGVNETGLVAVVSHANKVSQNLYAESICKRLGHAATGEPGSWANGTAAVGAYLKKIGVGDGEFKLNDGCGLSRENGVSPNAVCKVLEANFGGGKSDYLKSLAVGGVDGTLEHRFTQKDLKGKVFAKTGFIEGVSALSGYLDGRDGNWYVFSILINGIPAKSNSIYKDLQEKIVRAVNNPSK
ncbi:MAG TPA: D-alanyl-D-alanine carboxypeptidase/D-alanyl-D-alanine-endopeptidase [Tepidisphaeraceae bacterium]|nr:D-alanyl-D-alanine carboxypeptidase/D-alanyl-D-alanine-endopeptidase [Tepidisphaeraceae bacterium]